MSEKSIVTPEKEANSPYNYQTLKAVAKALRQKGYQVQVGDLLVLATKNDPFYTGSPSQLRDAAWFAEVFAKLGGARNNLHLRRIHYSILELPARDRELPLILTTKLKRADGSSRTLELTHYENYQRCWDWLTEAAKTARYLGLLPLDVLTDQRAKELTFTFYATLPQPGDFDYEDPTPRYVVDGEWEELYLPELPELPFLDDMVTLPEFAVDGYTGIAQKYHLEIWLEKAEGEDVLLPLCRRYRVNLVPGMGDMSISTPYRFAQRVRKAGRPAVILYISDFDPSGVHMPLAVARKLEFFVRNHGFDDLDIRLEPIMLTEAQVVEYQLPPTPIKDTDMRKDRWEAEFGGAVELNAMFSSDARIRAAREIVEQAILKYYDPSLLRRAEQQLRALQAALADEREEIIAEYDEAWAEIVADYTRLQDEFDVTGEEFATLIAPFQTKINAYRNRLAELQRRGQATFEEVFDELETRVTFEAEEEYPLPEGKTVEPDGVLYHSERGYWEQLLSYWEQKINSENGVEGTWLMALAAIERGES